MPRLIALCESAIDAGGSWGGGFGFFLFFIFLVWRDVEGRRYQGGNPMPQLLHKKRLDEIS